MKAFHYAVLIVGLAGCSDLETVREFARSGSEVAASQPIFGVWEGGYTRARQLAASAELKAADPVREARLKAGADIAAENGPFALRAAQTLSIYLRTLALLADDKLPDVGQEAGEIQKSLAAVKGGASDSGAVNAILTALEVPLDLWRQRTVRDLIVNSDPHVQVITAFLATAAITVRSAQAQVGQTFIEYYDVSAINTRDSGVRAMLRRAHWEEEARIREQQQKALKAAEAFKAIGKDHAVLARNAQSLSGEAVKNALANDIPLLQGALNVLTAR
jgi:hypothetical protein